MRQFWLVVFLAVPAGASSVTPEMDKLVLEGIDALYRMDFAAADKAAEKAMALQPDFPHPYLGAAATELIRFTYGAEASDPSQLKHFEAKVDKAAQVAERWLKTHPRDADALMVLGSAHGISSRLALVRRDWLDAFSHGRKAMKSVRAAQKADPELWDAYLGTGMFDYYVDTIPRFAGWLAKVMLGGDRARGLKQIKIAAEKGHYAKTAAQLILVEVYTEDNFGGRNPPEAVRLMTGIRAKYPDSPMIHSAHVVSLYEDKRYAEAARESEEYLRRVATGRYAAMNKPKGHALLGTVLWAAGDKEKALAEFRAGAAPVPGALRTRWAVWSRVRAGQVLDALGRRADAVAEYRAAFAERKLWDFKGVLKPCLAKPCLDGLPGHFSPPY
ncbi:MAG: hypothetical protein SF051_06620 [Elusimicrobiota bacterium]|nr:hypothetical protein [Elusimicrobiota bacterium]